MSFVTRDEGPFGQLPPEILVKIFCLLDPKSLVFSASRVNFRWRAIIQQNLRKMQLVPTHCRVDVMDMDPNDESVDGTHPMIQYTFTVFDDSKSDYKSKLKCCWRANGNWTQLYLTHRVGLMECEWESADDQRRPVKADSTVIEGLLKYMRIEAIRFDVRKIGRWTMARTTDEKFAHVMDFCAGVCTQIDLKSLLLTSHSLNFPWCFGPKSLKRLSSFRVKNLILENMTAADCFGEGKSLEYMDLNRARYLHLKLDPTHRQELENILWVDINGSVLTRLLASHQRCLEFRVYSECPQVISLISAGDMVMFLRGWRGLLSPWIIRGIHFNASFTISEFRTVATRAGLMGDRGILADFPYCRFRTCHPTDPNAVLELTCFGNVVSTQWQIRSGYSRT